MRIVPDDIAGIVGILPAPSVPGADRWDCEDSVDLDAVAAMTARVRAGGVSIVMTGGSFGEGASLLDHESEGMVATVADTLRGAGGGLLFAGATTLNTRATIRLARALIDRGADGLFLGRPMWMALDGPGTLRFYADVAEALPGVPIVVYDNQFAFKGRIDTATYAELAKNPSVIATKHIGGPSMGADIAAADGRMAVLPIDAAWGAVARDHAGVRACWTGNAADGTEPLAALAAAVACGDHDRAEAIGARMAWAQAPMFPGGKLENFVDYNVPIAHGRLEGSGLVPTHGPRPPYLHAPEGYVEGGREVGRRWRALAAEMAGEAAGVSR